ncbi:MAG: type I restriction endonuclease subunit R [Planctomycetota bacterium]
MITEKELEEHALTWLQDVGWQYAFGPDLAPDGATPERTDYRQVLLQSRLLAALRRLNPDVPGTTLEEVAVRLTHPEHLSLAHDNRAFHTMLLDGVPTEFERDGRRVSDKVRLIDFARPAANDFLVCNQFTITGTARPRRPDILAFVNGIPLVDIELKNPADEETDVWEAWRQLQTYKAEISDLYRSNLALVISDGVNARVGSLTADRDRFQPWRAVTGEEDRPLVELELEPLLRGFFDPERLLQFLRHFVLFEQGRDGLVKKIAGYHQFHAVREAVRATVIAASKPAGSAVEVREPRATWGSSVLPGSRKGGIVWHTQGSGKSLTMAFFAGLLVQRPELQNPTIVVITDRNDLDRQLFDTFVQATPLLKEMPVQAEDREQLRSLLAARTAGGIVFTTIQKFAPKEDEERLPRLCERTNVVVIADEAHRSQYGFKSRFDKKRGKFRYGLAIHLRDALPMATFVGFTGTPLSSEDRDTRDVFGEYVSVYDVQRAVEDKATVPIYYESQLAKIDINRAEIDAIEAEAEEIWEDEEDLAKRERGRIQWATLESLVGAQPRVDQIAAHLVMHLDARLAVIDGKAMLVCMSRDICVRMYEAIRKLRPHWHDEEPTLGAMKVVMTGSANDGAALRQQVYTPAVRKQIEGRFKDPADPLRLVIVRDMWLTGFDVPCLHTMYVDKPMRGHNLMQAIARVNRVFRSKEGGLVVDYLGVAAELRKALRAYTESPGRGELTRSNHEALRELLARLDAIRGMFRGFEYASYRTSALPLLAPAANFVLGLEDGQKRFFDLVLAVTKAQSLCGTLDEALAVAEEIAFFQAVRAVIAKAGTPEARLGEANKNQILRQLLDSALVVHGVENVFVLAGLGRADISVLSDAFLEEVRRLPHQNLAAELLQKLLRNEIESRARTNVVLEQRFGERLLAIVNRYRNRAIESAQVISELIAMAKEFREASGRGERVGLRDDELAFYDALADNAEVRRVMADDLLRKIALELTEKLRASTTVDWGKRESVRARLRNLVRITLRRNGYPPEGQEAAVDLVMRQAERLSDAWTTR